MCRGRTVRFARGRSESQISPADRPRSLDRPHITLESSAGALSPVGLPHFSRFSTIQKREKNPTIDAITVLGNGTLFAFKGEWYWRLLDEGGIEKGYPRLIIDSWPFDSNIDDILTDGDGDSYVFKGDKYWLLNRDGELQKGYPWRINRGLIDMPDDIDAAFIYSEDDQPYMFKKDRYWPYSRFGMGRQWPKSTKGIFKGEIPSKIDAALRFNDQSFLFVGTKYYKVNGFRMRISEGYPKSIGDQWFGCDGNSHHIK